METKKKEGFIAALCLLVGVIWGGGFIAVQAGLDAGLSPVFICFGRFAIASAVLFLLMPRRILSMSKEEVKAGILPALFMSLGFFFQSTALQFTTPGNNALITGTYIMFVPFIAWFILKKKPSRRDVIAAVLCFLGITVLSLPSMQGFSINLGDLLTLVSAVFFACHFLALEGATKKVEGMRLTFLQLFFAAVLFLFATFAFGGFPNGETIVGGALPLLYLGLFSSCVAYIVQTYAQSQASASKVSILLSTECVFGGVFSIALGYEPFTLYILIGGLMIMVAIMLIEGLFDRKNTEMKRKGE